MVEAVNDILMEQGVTEEATQTDIFRYRTAAARRVYLGLSTDEQAAILKMIEEREDIVPPEVKQKCLFKDWPHIPHSDKHSFFRRAKNLAAQVVATSARKNWMDMGVYTLTFYGYINQNGMVHLEM